MRLDRWNCLTDLTVARFLSDTPGQPADKIVISRVTEEKCTVSWKIPLEDGGDTVTHYIVERRETSRLNWVMMETECKTLSCVSSRLIKNNEYIFRVRGVNKFGPGVPLESEPVIARNAYSEPQQIPIQTYKFMSPILLPSCMMWFEGEARIVTDFFVFSAIPSQPGTPEATAVGKEHVIIEWLKPESDGGSELKNYIVDKREKSSTRWGSNITGLKHIFFSV